MKKTNTRVRLNDAAKAAPAQAPNHAEKFVVKITSTIRESAADAGETVEQFMATAIRQKLETNAEPLQLLLKGDDSSKWRDLYVDLDGRLFLWNGFHDQKPEAQSLAEALWWWKFGAKQANAFRDRRYKGGSAAEVLISTLLHHWKVVFDAEQEVLKRS